MTGVLPQPGQKVEGGLPRGDVHPGERLVEQQHVRLLRQRPGQEDPLLLAAGQLTDGPMGQIGDAQLLQDSLDDLAVATATAASATCPGRSGPWPPRRTRSRESASRPPPAEARRRSVPVLAAAARPSMSISPAASGSRPTMALNRVDLPAPFGPDDGHLRSLGDGERHGVERRPGAVEDGNAAQLDGARSPQGLDDAVHVPPHHVEIRRSVLGQRVRVQVGDDLDARSRAPPGRPDRGCCPSRGRWPERRSPGCRRSASPRALRRRGALSARRSGRPSPRPRSRSARRSGRSSRGWSPAACAPPGWSRPAARSRHRARATVCS